jgi:hypothetical protein
MTDAGAIAAAEGLSVFRIASGSTGLVLDKAYERSTFIGPGHGQSSIALNSKSVLGSTFEGLSIFDSALAGSGIIEARNCFINNASNLSGFFHTCTINGTLTSTTFSMEFYDCEFRASSGGDAIVDATAMTTGLLGIFGGSGRVEIRGLTIATANFIIMKEGKVTLAASNNAGTMLIEGSCELDDQSAVGMVVTDNRNVVRFWNRPIATHTDKTTFGGFVQKLLTFIRFFAVRS